MASPHLVTEARNLKIRGDLNAMSDLELTAQIQAKSPPDQRPAGAGAEDNPTEETQEIRETERRRPTTDEPIRIAAEAAYDAERVGDLKEDRGHKAMKTAADPKARREADSVARTEGAEKAADYVEGATVRTLNKRYYNGGLYGPDEDMGDIITGFTGRLSPQMVLLK